MLFSLALTAGLGSTSAVHHDVRAYVTGYNTIPGQTDSTPCIGASGADICGRRDAVACPRRISLGTTVQINGATYICEDRLAKKFDTRFDISCDKDTACPPTVTGWKTIRVYDDELSEAAPPAATAVTQASAAPVKKIADKASARHPLYASRIARLLHGTHAPAAAKPTRMAAKATIGPVAQRPAKAFKVAAVLRGGRG